MCSNFFFSKSKTLLYNPKNFISERERFGSIMNFVSKTNIFDFFWGTLVGKRSKRSLKNVGLTLLQLTTWLQQAGQALQEPSCYTGQEY